MDLRRISPAITREDKLRVVTVDQVKAQARVPLSDNSEDKLIESYIVSAYDYLSGPEGWLGRCCLLDEEWEDYVGMPDRLRHRASDAALQGRSDDRFRLLPAGRLRGGRHRFLLRQHGGLVPADLRAPVLCHGPTTASHFPGPTGFGSRQDSAGPTTSPSRSSWPSRCLRHLVRQARIGWRRWAHCRRGS